MPANPSALILSVITLLGCSAKDTSSTQTEQPAANSTATASAETSSKCPTVSEVSTIVGFKVRKLTGQMYGDQLVCGYIDAADDAGTQVTGYSENISEADEGLARLASNVKAIAGEGASLESISVGERGQAYGNPSKSEAAAVASGRYYHVEIIEGATRGRGEKKDAAIALLKRMIG